jgi:hypothetical protein
MNEIGKESKDLANDFAHSPDPRKAGTHIVFLPDIKNLCGVHNVCPSG